MRKSSTPEFHAVDRLLVDVKLVGEVGHNSSLCDTPPAFRHQVTLRSGLGLCRGSHGSSGPFGDYAPMRPPTSWAIFTAMRRALFCRASILIWMTTVMQGDTQGQH
jgi:hypothetical protein